MLKEEIQEGEGTGDCLRPDVSDLLLHPVGSAAGWACLDRRKLPEARGQRKKGRVRRSTIKKEKGDSTSNYLGFRVSGMGDIGQKSYDRGGKITNRGDEKKQKKLEKRRVGGADMARSNGPSATHKRYWTVPFMNEENPARRAETGKGIVSVRRRRREDRENRKGGVSS